MARAVKKTDDSPDELNPNAGTEEWQWETKVDEEPTIVIMEQPGDVFIGQYDGRHTIIPPTGDTFEYLAFWANDGRRYGLSPSYKLDEQFAPKGEIREGQWIRITLVKNIDMGAGRNPLKDYRIDVRK